MTSAERPYDIHFTVSVMNNEHNREEVSDVLEAASGVESYTIDNEASDIDVRIRVMGRYSPRVVFDAISAELYEILPRGVHIRGAGV